MSSNWRLDGYKVVVTGSSKGIGYATAREFIGLGAVVMVNGRKEEEVAAAVAALGANAQGCVAGHARRGTRRGRGGGLIYRARYSNSRMLAQ